MVLTETELKELKERKLHKLLEERKVNLEEGGLGEWLNSWIEKTIKLDKKLRELYEEGGEDETNDLYLEIKKFWIGIINDRITNYRFEGTFERYPNWEQTINSSTSFNEIEKIGRDVVEQACVKGKGGWGRLAWRTLGINEKMEWEKCLVQDLPALGKRTDYQRGKLGVIKENLKKSERAKTEWTQKYWQHDIKLNQKQRKIERLKKANKRLEQQIWEKDEQRDSLKKQKNKLETRLKEQVNHLHQLAKSKEKALESLETEKTDIIIKSEKKLATSENRVKRLINQRDEVCKKLETLKNNQQELKSTAESKKVCLSLIKHENITDRFLNKSDETLAKAIKNTSKSLINSISKTQDYLGVGNLTKIESSHPLPKGKKLKDLIDFYNNTPSPQQGNSQIIITEPQEIVKEIKAEVEKPVTKEVEKTIEVENKLNISLEEQSKEQKKEIVRLKNIIKELEKNLSQNNSERTLSPNQQSNNKIIALTICLALLTLILTSGVILTKKKKKTG